MTHRWRALGEVDIAPPPPPTARSLGVTVGSLLVCTPGDACRREKFVLD